MRRVTSFLVLSTALAAPFAFGAAAAETASVPASASGSASAPAPAHARRKADAEDEVEVITLEGEPEYDRQRFAVGLLGGLGWVTTRGSGLGVGIADFALLGEFGLGRYGMRVPWTLEFFVAFALNRQSFQGDSTTHPNRFTEAAARLVYRGEQGLLEGRWLSLGAGIVFTSYAQPDVSASGNIAPGALLDLGFGVQEWTTRLVRYGFGARVPVELSKHPGVGAIGFFYAQVGLGG
jgi:hypothetical protein